MLLFVILQIILMLVPDSVVGSKLEPINHVSNIPQETLQKDLSEFLNLIPIAEISNLTKFFYSNDESMRQSYDYLRNKGCKLVVESLSKLTLVKKFTSFLNDSGVNFAELGKRIETIVLTSGELESIDGN